MNECTNECDTTCKRYDALAAQLVGLYHKDGGPVTLVQVDNETPDWQCVIVMILFRPNAIATVQCVLSSST